MLSNVFKIENHRIVIPFKNVNNNGVIMRHGILAWSGWFGIWSEDKDQKKENLFEFITDNKNNMSIV
ncbi:hypothetical protein [Bombilactobacillus mellis]|uniref:hypothetical protein n=1 Tax=Bombilactobacillus mellis TaxID=1218508 RepID=UPI00157FC2F5|nr:hypothetical protein [Bombilactobacillus mellis]NUF24869.1 hypothetical protein [Bombilactobacillus mellis]